MQRIFFLMSFGISAMLLGAQQAQAQGASCADHSAVVAHLAERYGESRQIIALGSDNVVVELFASDETGTWTITITRPGGPTCLAAAGSAYQYLNEDLPVDDSGA